MVRAEQSRGTGAGLSGLDAEKVTYLLQLVAYLSFQADLKRTVSTTPLADGEEGFANWKKPPRTRKGSHAYVCLPSHTNRFQGRQ